MTHEPPYEQLEVKTNRASFSMGIPVTSTNKTDRHDKTEILLKVTLNTITLTIVINLRLIYIHLIRILINNIFFEVSRIYPPRLVIFPVPPDRLFVRLTNITNYHIISTLRY